MYNPSTAKALSKLMKVIEDVITSLEQKEYTVEHSFGKKWWEGEYGGYVKYGDQYVLWFGLWHEYWESTGSPLCFGVQDRKWDKRICSEFIKNHPKNVKFPLNDPKPYLLENIEKDIILSEDPVSCIFSVLDKELQDLGGQIRETKKD